MLITAKQKDKFINDIKKKLISSENIYGECVFYSILNSLYFLKTEKIKVIKDIKTLEGIIDQKILDVIVSYRSKLRYSRQKDAINHLIELNYDLKEFGYVINLFKLKEKVKYVYTNWAKNEARMNSNKVKKIPISMIEPLLIGSTKIQSSVEVQQTTVKKKVINLVAVPNRSNKEVDISFVKDVSILYKMFESGSGKKIMNKSYTCEQCMVVQYKKETYEEHVKTCLGKNTAVYVFTLNNTITFNKTKISLPHPFTIYYDLETTCGQDGKPMYTLTYVYCISFMQSLRDKYSELENLYVFRHINQSSKDLNLI